MDKSKTYYVSVNSSTSNTIATIVDRFGNTIAWKSCGSMGFPGRQKATEVANEATGKVIFEILKLLGVVNLGILLKGLKHWQTPFVKGMLGKVKEDSDANGVPSNFHIVLVKDVSSIPHNGCRRWKSRAKNKPRKLRSKKEAQQF